MKLDLAKAARAAALLILLAGAILQTLGGSAFPSPKSENDWGNDDSYISYHYAENLARGDGLVFNPGERVEGYSNFLYVLMMVPAFWLTSRDGVYFYSVLLNLLCALVALWLFSEYLRRELGEGSAAVGSLLFALCLPLWVAVASGMETALVLLLSLAVWFAVERVALEPARRSVNLLCLLMVLSVLARVDGFLIAGIALAYLLLKRRFRAALFCVVTLGIAGAAYEGWRYAYYGALLPTPYYVKVAGLLSMRVKHAFLELGKIALFEGLFPYLLAFLFVVVEVLREFAKAREGRLDGLKFETLFAVCWVSYWIYIGGDHFWDRFLVILFPMGIFALLKYLGASASRRSVAFVVVLLAVLQVGPPFALDPRFRYVFNKYDSWIGLGKFLGERFPGRTLATGAIGKVPFFSGLYTIDMLGLADPVIVHRPAATEAFEPGHIKFDADYVFSRKPDLIVGATDPSLDMAMGMPRRRYEVEGYRIAYLASTLRPPPPVRIIDVSGQDVATVRGEVAEGYDFAVLVKK